MNEQSLKEQNAMKERAILFPFTFSFPEVWARGLQDKAYGHTEQGQRLSIKWQLEIQFYWLQ